MSFLEVPTLATTWYSTDTARRQPTSSTPACRPRTGCHTCARGAEHKKNQVNARPPHTHVRSLRSHAPHFTSRCRGTARRWDPPPHAALPFLPPPSSDAYAARPQAPLPRTRTALGRVPLRVDPPGCGAMGNRNEHVGHELEETTSMQSHASAPAVPYATSCTFPRRFNGARSLPRAPPRLAVASHSAVR